MPDANPHAPAATAGPVLSLPAPAPPSAEELSELLLRAQDFARDARAENTRRAYQSDWRDFTGWCQARGLLACPALAQTVALYLTVVSD